MMNRMKSTLVPLLIVAAAGTADAMGNGTDTLTGTEWRPVRIGTETVSQPKPYFRFGEDGKVTGHGGCNGFGGTYTFDGHRVTFSGLFGTMMACPGTIMENERGFLQALKGAKRLKRKGTKLVLFGKGGNKLAVFIERH